MNTEHFLILIVGGHPLLRFGIVALLKAQSWLSVCGEAGEAAFARRLCEERKPGLIVADLDVADGLALVRDFAKLHPEARILALSEREDASWMQKAFASGAHGYVSKLDSTAEVVTGLMALTQRERFVSERMRDLAVQQVVDGRLKSEARGVDRLSARELEVFRLVGQGVGTDGQAEALKLSVKTVETHRTRIKQKLNARDGEEVRRLAEAWLAKSDRGNADDAGKDHARGRGD